MNKYGLTLSQIPFNINLAMPALSKRPIAEMVTEYETWLRQTLEEFPHVERRSLVFHESYCGGNPNGDAAFASCALEIFEATDKAEYRAKALAYGEKVIRTFGDINYRGSCGTGSLMKMLPGRLFALTGDVRYRDILRRQCQDFVRYAEESLQTNVGTLVPVVNGLVLLEGERVFGEPRYRVAAQRGIDWCLGVNCDEVSVVNGVGKHQQDLEVWGQFFPSTPWIPGAVTHVKHGEYNLPNAGGLMLVAQKLNR